VDGQIQCFMGGQALCPSRVISIVGTLYIIGVGADDLEDMTLRALRILDEVVLIVADMPQIDRQLACHGITTPLMIPSDANPSVNVARILETLQAGDVALLISGLSPAPSAQGHQLILASLDHGFPVKTAPGPSLPVTALILSGLSAGSFRFLGELPQQAGVRRVLLASLEAECRTLVLLVPSGRLPEVLPDLAGILGERPVALIRTAGGAVRDIWRGVIGGLPEEHLHRLDPAPAILVVGGAREPVALWDGQCLRAEIRARRDQGLGAKEISQQLASESGWSRREIYRLAAEAGRFRQGE
jgi:16S rRNA (cytidine1402-2'-O)-methyltransferase